MGARDRILAKLARNGQGGEAADARLAAKTQTAPVPSKSRSEGEARIAQFIAQAEAVQATASRLSSMDDLPAALAEELRSRNLPARVRTGEDPLFDRDWGAVERSTGMGRLEEPATLSRAIAGVAETGTAVLFSGPDNPVTLTFLGETHFIVVPEGVIHDGFEALWSTLRDMGADPRTVNMVTGPSRSGDIGQTLQLGAHGPVAVHLFVVSEPDG